jgi:amino acid adenylation domain-containing protein
MRPPASAPTGDGRSPEGARDESEALPPPAGALGEAASLPTPAGAPPPAPGLDVLRQLAEAERRALLEPYLLQRAAAVMETAPSRLATAVPLAALGLDSLYAVQLAHVVETDLGVELSIAALLAGATVAEVAADLAARVAAGPPPAPPAPAPAGAPLPQETLPAEGPRSAAETTARLHSVGPAEPVAGSSAAASAASGAADRGEVPLTYGQRALYFLDRLAPEDGAYVIAGAARVRGGLDLDALRRALAALAERHPALRTTFVERAGAPVAVVRPPGEAERAGAVEQIEVAVGRLEAVPVEEALAAAAWRPFDLARGPLLRVTVLAAPGEPPPGEPVVALAVHHLVADFWSLEVLLGELAALYRPAARGAPAALRPLPLTYADHARRQQARLAGPRGEQLWDFWRRELAGLPGPLELPADRPRPRAQSFAGAAVPLRLPAPATRALRALASRLGATPFMALLALFQVLLARLSGQPEVVVGAPVAGRDAADLAGLVGYFVNPVALRADLAAGTGFAGLLVATRRRVLAAFAHQDYPFPLLAERLQPHRERGRSPIFQASLVLHKAHRPERQGMGGFALGLPGSRLRLAGLDLESVALPRRAAQFDLTLEAADEGDELAAILVYASHLFDATSVARWAGHLAALAAAAVAEPEARVAELPMLLDAERQQLHRWNATDRDFRSSGRDLAGLALDELFAAQAARTPEAVAVELAGETAAITYGELAARARRVAAALAALGAGPESIVGLVADRSLAMVVGLLGILEAGAAFLPIDPSYPRERIAYMLADAGPLALLVEERAAAALPAVGPPRLVLDAFAGPDPPASAGPVRRPDPGPDRLAYVLYTSGSTGKPKAAMNGHRGIVNRLLWFQEVEPLTTADRVLQKTPLSFDVSLWELFWPLVTGARLVLARPGGHLDAGYLVRTLAERGITTAHFVPSMLQIFLEAPGVERCAALRRVLASGEALGYETQERFFARLPGVALHNLYGPTETAIEVTHWRCRRGEGRRGVPIGSPIANVRIHLLDRRLQPVPPGVVGQLAIGGVAVGRGYLGRPDLTAERFVPDAGAGPGGEPGGRLYLSGDLARHLPGGAIEFLGRIDAQVKLRGVRIELGEVESALASHPAVAAAAVAARGEGAEQRLVGYVVPRAAAPATGELEEHLRRQLPSAMVPAAWMILAELPLTPSGKVDRRALPAPAAPAAAAGAGSVPPGTAVEEALAAIWCDVLKLERVGIYDDFFALGGHSLNANQVLARVRETFQVELPVPSLFEAPTIAGLAQAIARELMAEADGETLSEVLSDLGA